jgi:hypothetical protein
MFPALDRDLKFGFQANGSLVVARSPKDDATLKVRVEWGGVGWGGVGECVSIERKA